MKIISKTFFFSITILIIGFAVPTHSQAVHSNSPFGGNVFSISNDWCTITAISNPMDGGTISGAGTFPSGQTVNISATNSSGHTFINWTEDGKVVSTSPDYTFNINSNRILTANFNSDKIPWIQTAGPVGGVVSALAASGRNLYAGMMEGGVFLSTNNGTTWTPVNNCRERYNYFRGYGWRGDFPFFR